MFPHRLFPCAALLAGDLPWRCCCVAAAERVRAAPRDGRRRIPSWAGVAAWRQPRRPGAFSVWSPSQLLNVREAFVPTLMVCCGKIFINTPGMTFRKTPDGLTDDGAFRWHTVPMRGLSNRGEGDATLR